MDSTNLFQSSLSESNSKNKGHAVGWITNLWTKLFQSSLNESNSEDSQKRREFRRMNCCFNPL